MESYRCAVNVISVQVLRFFDSQSPFRIYHGSTNSHQYSPVHVTTWPSSQYLRAQSCFRDRHQEISTMGGTECVNGPLHRCNYCLRSGFSYSNGVSWNYRPRQMYWHLWRKQLVPLRFLQWNRQFAWNRSSQWRSCNGFISWKARSVIWHRSLIWNYGRDHASPVSADVSKEIRGMTGHPVMNMHEASQNFEEATSKASDDYLDGILFSQDCGVICSGRWTDQVGPRVQRFNQPKDPWFYLMQGTLSKTALKHLLLS